MGAGKYNRRITIQQNLGTEDEFNQKADNWQTFSPAWAAIYDLSGKQFFDAQRANSEVTTRIDLRRMSGVTSGMRVSCDGVIYDIQAVIDYRKEYETRLMCIKRES